MSHPSSHVIVWILQVNILTPRCPQSITRDQLTSSPGGGHHTPLGQGDGGVGQPAGQPPRVLAEVARGAVVAVRHPAPIVGLETCNIGDDAITATALNI